MDKCLTGYNYVPVQSFDYNFQLYSWTCELSPATGEDGRAALPHARTGGRLPWSTSLLHRRLLWSLLVLVGLSIVIFLIARVVPGDPAIALGPPATPEQVTNLRHKIGLDRPLIEQYGRYVSGLVRGNFGQSLLTQRVATTSARPSRRRSSSCWSPS